ncbi:MAG TPA: hypothetical protein VHP36_05090 [Chitinispirillaceae bacterium]|nr:hypothetical protein [Chitinispirillaceae bacterium]
MNNEDLFYKELASCPGLPSGQFDVICKKIHRRKIIRRLGITGTVSTVLIFTMLMVVNLRRFEKTAVQPEVAAELQIIQEYLNGEDLEDQIQIYAYFEEQ